jgi:hypothetical protein
MDDNVPFDGSSGGGTRWCFSSLRSRRLISRQDLTDLGWEIVQYTQDATAQLQQSEAFIQFTSAPSEKFVGCEDEDGDAEDYVADYFNRPSFAGPWTSVPIWCMLLCVAASVYVVKAEALGAWGAGLIGAFDSPLALVVAAAGMVIALAHRVKLLRNVLHKWVAFFLPYMLLRLFVPLMLAIGLLVLVSIAEAVDFSASDIVLPVMELASVGAHGIGDWGSYVFFFVGHVCVLLFFAIYATLFGPTAEQYTKTYIVTWSTLELDEASSILAAATYAIFTWHWGVDPWIAVPGMLVGSLLAAMVVRVCCTTAPLTLRILYADLMGLECMQPNMELWFGLSVTDMDRQDLRLKWNELIEDFDDGDDDDDYGGTGRGWLVPFVMGWAMVPPICTVGVCVAFDWTVDGSQEASAGSGVGGSFANDPPADRSRALVIAVAFALCTGVVRLILRGGSSWFSGQHSSSWFSGQHSSTDCTGHSLSGEQSEEEEGGEEEERYCSDEFASDDSCASSDHREPLEFTQLRRENTIALMEENGGIGFVDVLFGSSESGGASSTTTGAIIYRRLTGATSMTHQVRTVVHRISRSNEQ